MKITLNQLKELEACEPQIILFEKKFGASVELTKELMIENSIEFDLVWFANKILSKDLLKLYCDTMAPALKVYKETRDQALEAYDETKAQVFKETIAQASKVYDETKASVLFDLLNGEIS